MSVKNLVRSLIGLVRVSETAKFLGVSKETLFDCDRPGKLVPTRYPVTGYRYYSQENLDAFLQRKIEERSAFIAGTTR